MFKILLITALIALAANAAPTSLTWEKAWSTFPVSSNGAKCIYSSELSQFSCRGNSTVDFVTCDAVKNLPDVPEIVFGLGRILGDKTKTTTFGLYPKKIVPATNETIYLSRRWELKNEEKVLLSLYHAAANADFGVRVTDEKCYESLVEFLESNAHERVVELDTFEHEVLVEEKVSLIGDVLILEQPTRFRRDAGHRRRNGGGGGGGGMGGGILGGGGNGGGILPLLILSMFMGGGVGPMGAMGPMGGMGMGLGR
jgi:uncharacterized membrane protein YgcG